MNLLVVSHYYPPHVGGIENVARAGAERQAAAGARVEVLTTSPGAAPGVSTVGGVDVHRVAAWNGLERSKGVPFPVPSPGLLLRAARLVRRADVVHVHDSLYPTSWAAALWARLLRRRLVVTQHVDLVAHPSAAVRAVQRLVYATLGRFVLRTASSTVVLNSRVEAFVRGLAGPRARVVVVPNGVDTERFRPAADDAERRAARASFGLPADAVVAAFVGRFVPKKGFDVAVGAASPSVHVVLAGGERPADLADAPHCTFVGALAPDRLAELYRAADVFVLPSQAEGFPLTVQEAMASGLPVVTTDDPAYDTYRLDRDLVALVAPTVSDVRAALGRVAADPALRRRMGAYSRAVATGRFGWSAHLAAVGALYAGAEPVAAQDVPADALAADGAVGAHGGSR